MSVAPAERSAGGACRRDELSFGIIVAMAKGPVFIAEIVRRGRNVYFAPEHDRELRLPDGTPWNPHASYHASGQVHYKTFGKRVFAPEHRQPVGPGFEGSEPLFDLALGKREIVRAKPAPLPTRFAEVFEIPGSVLDGGEFYTLSVVLTEPGVVPPPTLPLGPRLIEHTFRHCAPWIYCCLWRIEP